MRVGQCQVEVDVGITPRGENYSTSRGERYGRMVELSKPADATTTPYYKRWALKVMSVHMHEFCLRDIIFVLQWTNGPADADLSHFPPHLQPVCGRGAEGW